MKREGNKQVKELHQKGERFCPQCGRAVGKSTSFCSRCGTNLKFWPDQQGHVESKQQGAFCPRCGRQLEQGIMFCSECGTNLRFWPDS